MIKVWSYINIQIYLFFPVVDGTSKEVSSKETAEETWSSWALVIFLGIALTLLVFAIAIGFLAKMNSTAASQQRQGLQLFHHYFFQYLPN